MTSTNWSCQFPSASIHLRKFSQYLSRSLVVTSRVCLPSGSCGCEARSSALLRSSPVKGPSSMATAPRIQQNPAWPPGKNERMNGHEMSGKELQDDEEGKERSLAWKAQCVIKIQHAEVQNWAVLKTPPFAKHI